LPAALLLPEIRHNVFLAAKEAINNVVKHAQASSVWVRLRLDARHFTLEIEDDGRGLPEAARSSRRNGLKNMHQRLEDVGGSFTIEPALDHGTIVRLTVPFRISDFGFRTSP
jgi:signal transduction histidine kinase